MKVVGFKEADQLLGVVKSLIEQAIDRAAYEMKHGVRQGWEKANTGSRGACEPSRAYLRRCTGNADSRTAFLSGVRASARHPTGQDHPDIQGHSGVKQAIVAAGAQVEE